VSPPATGPTDRSALIPLADDPDAELAWLQRAEAAGVPMAPMVVVPAHIEAEYYRWNNLPERIHALFADLNPRDPDEDDVEELAPVVAGWMMEHALLDGVIDHLYATLADLPDALLVRRPGDAGARARRGRPALLALKRSWAADWGLAAVMARCTARGDWLPNPRPVLLHDAEMHPDPELAGAASHALDRPVQAWSDGEGRLLRLVLPRAASHR
jgi:hypothetical protein